MVAYRATHFLLNWELAFDLENYGNGIICYHGVWKWRSLYTSKNENCDKHVYIYCAAYLSNKYLEYVKYDMILRMKNALVVQETESQADVDERRRHLTTQL